MDILKKKVRIIFALSIVVLLLQQIGRKTGKENNPAVDECLNYIGKLIKELNEIDRLYVEKKVNKARRALHRKVEDIDLESALVASIRVLVNHFSTPNANQIGFILSTFRKNLSHIENGFNPDENHVKKFENSMLFVLRGI